MADAPDQVSSSDPQPSALPAKIPALNPETQQVVMIDSGDAGTAQQAGWSLLSKQDALDQSFKAYLNTPAAQVATAAGGYLRGLSGGLSDLMLDKTGAVPGKALAQMSEENPIASGVGHGLGIAAGLLAGGEGEAAGAAAGEGGSALGSLAGGIPGLASHLGGEAVERLGLEGAEGLGATLARGAVRGAVETPFYGVGDKITEDVFENKPLTAESLLAEAGKDAVLGGLTGGALEGALGLAADKLPAVMGKASDLAEGLSKKLGMGGTKDAVVDYANDLSKLNDAADDSIRQSFKIRDQLIEQKLGNANQTEVPVQQFFDQIKSKVSDLEDEGDLKSKIGKIVEHYEGKAAAESTDLARQNLIDEMKTKIDAEIPYDRNPNLSQAARNRFKAMKSVADDARNFLEDNQVWGGAADVQRQFNKGFAALKPDVDAFGSQFMRKALGSDELEDATRGKVINTAKAETFLKNSAKDKIAAGEASGRLKSYTDNLKSYLDFVEEQSQDLPTGRRQFGIGDLVDRLGESQAAGTAAFKPSPVMQALKFAVGRERADAIESFGRKGEVLAKVARHASKVSEQIRLGAKSALESPVARSATTTAASLGAISAHGRAVRGESLVDAVARRRDEIDGLQRDDEKRTNALSGAVTTIQRHAPGVAGQMQMAMQNRDAYLSSQAPRSPIPDGSSATPPKTYKPSPTEAAKFARQHRAAFDPVSSLEDLKHGTLTPEVVATVRATSPQLYSQMSEALVSELAKRDDPPPYPQRAQIALFLGKPVDYSQKMLPRTQADYQAGGMTSPKESATNATPRARESGLAKLNLAERAETKFDSTGRES